MRHGAWVVFGVLLGACGRGTPAPFVTPGLPVLVAPAGSEPPACLAASPDDLEFGTAQPGCDGLTRSVQLYNVCARPLAIRGARLVAGSTGTDFAVVADPTGAVLTPGPAPAMLKVQYRPTSPGADRAAIIVSSDEGDAVVSLRGTGDVDPPVVVDTFVQNPPIPRVDTLVLVDASPSFLSQRASVRENLASLLFNVSHACVDARWSFASAEGAPGAAVQRLSGDAGVTSFFSRTPSSSRDSGFIAQALEAFDSLPVGSETEACAGPAAALLAAPDGGVRPGAWLSVLCVTDALDHTADAGAALEVLRALAPSRMSWNAVTALATSSCAVEAADDGTQAAFVAATSGVSADICSPTWSEKLLVGSIGGCGPQSRFFLTRRPALEVEVRIDGLPVPATAKGGEPTWSYQPTTNAITFEAGHEPPPSSRIEVSYAPACAP